MSHPYITEYKKKILILRNILFNILPFLFQCIPAYFYFVRAKGKNIATGQSSVEKSVHFLRSQCSPAADK